MLLLQKPMLGPFLYDFNSPIDAHVSFKRKFFEERTNPQNFPFECYMCVCRGIQVIKKITYHRFLWQRYELSMFVEK
jgi:hypothetical protein